MKRFVDTWVDLFRKHDLLTVASAIGFQALAGEIALVLLGLGVLGEIGREDIWTSHLAPQFEARVLPDVYLGINETVTHIFAGDSTGLIAFGSLLSIWEVSGVVRACMGALNRIYETEEHRPWWIRFPISFGISITLIAALLGAVTLILAVGGVVHGSWRVPFAIVRWAGSVLLIMLAFGLLVRFAPAERRAKKWASLGSILVVVAWIVESFVFKWYLTSLANFRSASGCLTVVFVVTSYLYVASIILLVGIELDELLRENANKAERTLRDLLPLKR